MSTDSLHAICDHCDRRITHDPKCGWVTTIDGRLTCAARPLGHSPVMTTTGVPVQQLVDYTDQDGDLLRIMLDPTGDPTEDIWIGVTDASSGNTNCVRIPRAMLLAALQTEVNS